MYSTIHDKSKALLVGPLRILGGGLAVLMSLTVIYYGLNNPLPRRQHANLILGAGLAVFYLFRAHTMRQEAEQSRLYQLQVGLLVLLGILSLVSTGYVHLAYSRWLELGRLQIYSNVDLLVGASIIYLVVDATFRKYGAVLGLVVVGTMLYGYAGPYLPGIFAHSGMGIEEIIRRQTITMSGVYGFLLQVGATWIAIFIIFAGIIESYGGFDYILAVGTKIKEYSRSGVAQTSLITSMFMGTMMGAAASNVATTGSFTIPLMEEHDIPPRFAAAAESVASTGGQILPPVMGTAAFLMANILGVPFSKVVVAGTIPALLFYAATALGIHFMVVGNRWGVDDDESASEESLEVVGLDIESENLLLRGIQYLIPVVVLVITLVALQFGPLTAGLYTIGAAVFTRAVYQLYNRTPKKFVTETFEGLYMGGKKLAPFMAILGSLGIVINVFSVTGLAQRIAYQLLGLTGGSLFVVLLVTMVVSLLLGLGIPTPAAYILVATILAPVLVEAGFTPLASHFFIFYFALLSALTPPVALAVTVAIGISGTEFIETAKEALRLGAPTYIIPFLFIFTPSILEWSFPLTVVKSVLFLIGLLALVMALSGYNGVYRLSWPQRFVVFGLFVGIVAAPSTILQFLLVIGFVVFSLYSSSMELPDWMRAETIRR